MMFPRWSHWQAEGLRLRRQRSALAALGVLFALLLAASTLAGLDARAWRSSAAQDAVAFDARLEAAMAQLHQTAQPGRANATAAYQLGRGELGATRMPVQAGLGLGVQRLEVLPARLKVSLDSRHVDARDPGPLRNPLLTDSGLPGVPALVALLAPLVALLLCAGLMQEEREQGRLGLLRAQSLHGLAPLLTAALGWRLLCLWAVTLTATLPALVLDPDSTIRAGLQWSGALAAFCALWVLLAGLLGATRLGSAASLLAGFGVWLALTFAVPGALVIAAQHAAPMPSRLQSIVAIRAAQHASEDREQALAQAWYAAHTQTEAHLPAVWPASFVLRVLDQERALAPLMAQFAEHRRQQAQMLTRGAWLSPGLALVLFADRLAGTDAASHARYLAQVQAHEQRWRDFLVPQVMDGKGLRADTLPQLPRF